MKNKNKTKHYLAEILILLIIVILPLVLFWLPVKDFYQSLMSIGIVMSGILIAFIMGMLGTVPFTKYKLLKSYYYIIIGAIFITVGVFTVRDISNRTVYYEEQGKAKVLYVEKDTCYLNLNNKINYIISEKYEAGDSVLLYDSYFINVFNQKELNLFNIHYLNDNNKYEFLKFKPN